MKQKYTVNLADCEIHIVTDEPREEVDAIVGAVDRRIREIHLHSKSCSRVDAALILCLEYCAEKSELQKKLKQANAEIERMAVLAEASARENAALEGEIDALRASLSLPDSRRARRTDKAPEPQLVLDDLTKDSAETEEKPVHENAVQRILSDDTTAPTEEAKPKRRGGKKRATAIATANAGAGEKPQSKKVRAMFDMISFDDIDS